MMLTPSDAVRSMYSDPGYMQRFINVGLWPSEKFLIDRFFKAGESVLDIGCGAGRVAIALSLEGYNTTGIDILPPMLEAGEKQIAVHRTKTRLLPMDAADMAGFAGGSFDNAIMAYNVYELIHGRERRGKVLAEVSRVLKPGGHFILTIRSGFAFGKRMLWWLLMPLVHPVMKIRLRGKCEWSIGDAMKGKSYHHYYNPFKIAKSAENHGMRLVYFNSSRNIERNKRAGFLTHFSPDRSLFYVFKKVGQIR